MTEIPRSNPFQPLYEICDAGNSKAKFAALPPFPRLIDVEMTNTCNFRCLMCPTGNYSQSREKGFMTPEVFYKILKELKPHGTAIRFIRWGEPLSHPNIIEFIQACTDAGLLTHLNTNGSKLDETMISSLIGAGLKSLKYSFQGTDRKTYNEMRNTDFYDGLIEKMGLFKKMRGDSPFPFLHVSTTITYETPAMVEQYKRDMAGLVDTVAVGRTVLDFIDLKTVRLRPHELAILTALRDQESVVKIHPECPEVYDKLSVNWDGEVTACCWDADKLMIIGDVREQTLEEIWRSDKLNEYRRVLADMRHDDLPLCKNCYDTHGLTVPGSQNL